MALGEQTAKAPARIPQTRALQPSHCLAEIRNAGIDATCFNFPVATRRFRGCGVIWQRSKRQRFVTILHASFRIALLNVRHSHAPQADYLEADIVESGAVLDGAAAVT